MVVLMVFNIDLHNSQKVKPGTIFPPYEYYSICYSLYHCRYYVMNIVLCTVIHTIYYTIHTACLMFIHRLYIRQGRF